MSVPVMKFQNSIDPEFFASLRQRVNQYFKDNEISKYANREMKIKTVFMLFLYLSPFLLMVTGVITSTGLMFLMWAIMGFGMAGIGLSIMHDANHGSYSKRKNVNNWLGYLLNIIGGYHINWKIQHNVLHHTYTNIHGLDEDIDKPVMRFSPDQERKPIFKYQIFYAPFLYGLMTIYWLISKDIEQLISYKKQDLLSAQGLTFKRAIINVAFNKAWYIAVFIVLPLLILPVAWWQILLGFLLMHFIAGLILAFVFQPAHVVQETNFYKTNEENTMENNWAIHQLLTTSNYANNSIYFSWFIGGLNHQIEHHLFPNICHVHYKHLSPIVAETAREFNLPYNQHRTFLGALTSHFTLLNDLGTGKWDKRAAKLAAVPLATK